MRANTEARVNELQVPGAGRGGGDHQATQELTLLGIPRGGHAFNPLTVKGFSTS